MPNCDVCNELLQLPPQHGDPSQKPRDKVYRLTATSEMIIEAAQNGCRYCSLVRQVVEACNSKWTFDALNVSLGSQQLNRVLQRDKSMLVIWRGEVIDRATAFSTTIRSHQERLNGLTYGNVIEIYAEMPYPHPFIGASLKPRGHVDINETIELVTEWIRKCEDEHPNCRAPDKARLPTRVIDLCPSDGSGLLRLYESTPGENAGYVALSYCWGVDQNLKLTKDTYADRRANIPRSDLPRTVQDAVDITRRLGVRFIWIDALCIIQDDDNGDDWRREAAKMDSVYENATLTIAATSSPGCQVGCFVANPATSDHASTYEIPWEDERGQTHRVFAHQLQPLDHSMLEMMYQNLDEDHHQRHPLFTRGWTFQERLLSRRIIHFMPSELVWECRSTYWCECGGSTEMFDLYPSWAGPFPKRMFYQPSGAPIEDVITPTVEVCSYGNHDATTSLDHDAYGRWVQRLSTQQESRELWMATISTFTSRQLSYESDRLPALAGIAKRFQTSGRGKYLAGLWHNQLVYYLAWTREESSITPSCRTANPTWSWTSIKGQVRFVEKRFANQRNSFLEYLPSPTVISAACEPSENELTGPINCGTIKLKGRFIPVASYFWWLPDTKLGKDGKQQPHYYAFYGRMIRDGQGTDFNLDITEFDDGFYRGRNPQQGGGAQEIKHTSQNQDQELARIEELAGREMDSLGRTYEVAVCLELLLPLNVMTAQEDGTLRPIEGAATAPVWLVLRKSKRVEGAYERMGYKVGVRDDDDRKVMDELTSNMLMGTLVIV